MRVPSVSWTPLSAKREELLQLGKTAELVKQQKLILPVDTIPSTEQDQNGCGRRGQLVGNGAAGFGERPIGCFCLGW